MRNDKLSVKVQSQNIKSQNEKPLRETNSTLNSNASNIVTLKSQASIVGPAQHLYFLFPTSYRHIFRIDQS